MSNPTPHPSEAPWSTKEIIGFMAIAFLLGVLFTVMIVPKPATNNATRNETTSTLQPPPAPGPINPKGLPLAPSGGRP
jgi:hypothetical protein